MTTIKCAVFSMTDKPRFKTLVPRAAPPAATRTGVFSAGEFTTPVYDRAALGADFTASGPLLIEEPASVTVVSPGQYLSVAPSGHLLIRAAGEDR
jgi:N-methylhydantoinase A